MSVTSKEHARFLSWMISIIFLQLFSAIIYYYYSSQKQNLCQFYRWMIIVNIIMMGIETPLFSFTQIFGYFDEFMDKTGKTYFSAVLSFGSDGSDDMPWYHFIIMIIAIQQFAVHSTINVLRIIYEYNYSLENNNGAITAKKYFGPVLLGFNIVYTSTITISDDAIMFAFITLVVIDYFAHFIQFIMYCIKLKDEKLNQDVKYTIKCKAGIIAVFFHCVSIMTILLQVNSTKHVWYAPVYVCYIFQNIGWGLVSWNTEKYQLKDIVNVQDTRLNFPGLIV